MNIIVGTRGSKLALTQTNTIVAALKALDDSHTYEVKIITTKGDLNHHLPLSQVGGSGLFVKEIEQLVVGQPDVGWPASLSSGSKLYQVLIFKTSA